MKKQETSLKLTKTQIQSVINEQLQQDQGLNDLFSMMVNGLMVSERNHFLSEQKEPGNKGNGYRNATRSGIGSKLSLRIPRDRLGVFQPVILGLLNEQEEQVKQLCYQLYGKGLTTRQIEDIVESIYGSSYSKSSISRITTDFSSLVDAWLKRKLDVHYPIIYIDAIHIKVRRETVATEAYYILLALKEDLTREVLTIVNIPQESAQGWQEVLEGIKERGVEKVGLFVFDGLTGLPDVLGKVFSQSMQQRCILHYQRNLNKHVRLKDRKEFSKGLKTVFNPDIQTYKPEQACENLDAFLLRWKTKYPVFAKAISDPLKEQLFTYLHFDYRVRRMIYTTNWIERLNKSFRRTLHMRNAMPTPRSALVLLGYVAIEMEEKTYSYPVTNFRSDENFI